MERVPRVVAVEHDFSALEPPPPGDRQQQAHIFGGNLA
jgi:hypothetical protein